MAVAPSDDSLSPQATESTQLGRLIKLSLVASVFGAAIPLAIHEPWLHLSAWVLLTPPLALLSLAYAAAAGGRISLDFGLVWWVVGWGVLFGWQALCSFAVGETAVDPRLARLAVAPVFVFLLFVLTSRQYLLRSLLVVILVVAAFNSALALVQWSLGMDVGNPAAYFGAESGPQLYDELQEGSARVVGLVGANHSLANWTLSGFCLAWAFAYAPASRLWSPPVDSRRMAVFLLCLCAAATIATSSRAGIGLLAVNSILLMLAAVFVRMSSAVRWLKVCWWAAMAGSIVFLVAWGYAGNETAVGLVDRFADLAESDSGSGLSFRGGMYRAAVDTMFANPLFGVGFGNSADIWLKYGLSAIAERGYRVHNSYLLIGAESGLVGLGIFLVLAWYPAYAFIARAGEAARSRSARMIDVGLFVSVVSANLYGLITATQFHPTYFPVYLLLGGALIHRKRLRPDD